MFVVAHGEMGMDKQTILKVAEIARLKLAEEELSRFEKEFESIFDYFSDLKKLDLREEFGYATDNKNVFRDDRVKAKNSEEILKNVPRIDKRYLKVPKGLQ